MKTAFQLIEEHGLTLHGDIEHFAELVRAEALAKPDFWEGYVPEPVKPAQQEPVGEVVLEGLIGDSQVVRFHMYKEIPPIGAKLYTSPPAQRKPLTNEQIRKLVNATIEGVTVSDAVSFRAVARAIEAAHGIKENT